MKLKEFTHCIIVDERDRPMSYIEVEKQLCYCNNETWEDEFTFIDIYTIKEAKKYIAKSQKFREKNGWGKSIYRIMPVILP